MKTGILAVNSLPKQELDVLCHFVWMWKCCSDTFRASSFYPHHLKGLHTDNSHPLAASDMHLWSFRVQAV